MFFLVLPYRAKNPPERFPYVTITLIALNVLVYAWTTQDFLQVRDSYVLDSYPTSLALSYSNMNVWRFFTSMFLHENLLHIGGNMLFLWLFGSAVEGRLGHAVYTAVYLIAGLFGAALQTFIFGHAHPHIPSLGASGAIMGVVGAYVYMFAYSTIRVFYFYWFPIFMSLVFLVPRLGIASWQAWWVVVFFFLLDIVNALMSAHDSVAHLAHYGGLAVGLGAMFLLRPARDSEYFSNAQAIRSDIKDYDLLSFDELDVLMERHNQDVELIMSYCEKALVEQTQGGEEKCRTAIQQHAKLLADQADPERLANFVLKLRKDLDRQPQVFYLRLATRLEQDKNNDLALHMYNRVYELDPSSVDSERALYRFGFIMERAYFDVEQARAAYSELLRLFPEGYLSFETRRALARLGGPVQPAEALAESEEEALALRREQTETSSDTPSADVRTRADFLETGDLP